MKNSMDIKKIRRIMRKTCFNSLAFCCGRGNPCGTRDSVISELGLAEKDFYSLKRKFNSNLFKLLEDRDNKKHGKNS